MPSSLGSSRADPDLLSRCPCPLRTRSDGTPLSLPPRAFHVPLRSAHAPPLGIDARSGSFRKPLRSAHAAPLGIGARSGSFGEGRQPMLDGRLRPCLRRGSVWRTSLFAKSQSRWVCRSGVGSDRRDPIFVRRLSGCGERSETRNARGVRERGVPSERVRSGHGHRLGRSGSAREDPSDEGTPLFLTPPKSQSERSAALGRASGTQHPRVTDLPTGRS